MYNMSTGQMALSRRALTDGAPVGKSFAVPTELHSTFDFFIFFLFYCRFIPVKKDTNHSTALQMWRAAFGLRFAVNTWHMLQMRKHFLMSHAIVSSSAWPLWGWLTDKFLGIGRGLQTKRKLVIDLPQPPLNPHPSGLSCFLWDTVWTLCHGRLHMEGVKCVSVRRGFSRYFWSVWITCFLHGCVVETLSQNLLLLLT